MSSATWDEIKRLAVDFKRAQMGTTAQMLTERNCVEIITSLMNMNLIRVIYTLDGKSYLTPEELEKEIYEELEVQGGRVNLVDLQKTLNVDLSQIESKVHEILNKDPHLQLILGQLITETYTRKLAQSMRDIVEEQGQLHLSECTKTYNLPGTFITELVATYLHTVIQAHHEGDSLYTDAFINKHRAQIQGYFTACTRPVQLAPIIHRMNLPERLFHRILDEQLEHGRVKGSFTANKFTFVPAVFSTAQESYVREFYTQNGYIEHAILTRIGLAGGQQVLKKWLSKAVHLSKCSLEEDVVNQLLAGVNDAISKNIWLDCNSLLPVIIDQEDLKTLLKQTPHDCRIMADSILISGGCLEKCLKLFDPIMSSKAEMAIKENPKLLQPDRLTGKIITDSNNASSDASNKAFNKSSGKGGGQRGKEKKTKVTKKKYFLNDRKGESKDIEDDDTTENGSIPFLTIKEIKEHLIDVLTENAPEELLDEVAAELEAPLLRNYQTRLHNVILQTSTTQQSRTTTAETENKISLLLNNMRLFEKGSLLIDNATLKSGLLRHLRRVLGGELLNLLCYHAALQSNIDCPPEWLTPQTVTQEMRMKLIGQFSTELNSQLKHLHQMLRLEEREDLQDFFQSVDSVLSALGVFVKRLDKKKEKPANQEVAAQLLSQLDQGVSVEELDSALLLLTASCLLCQTVIGYPIHAPGKLVPQLINWLQTKLLTDDADLLVDFQEQVVAQIKSKNSDDYSQCEEIDEKLSHLKPKLLSLAKNWKKVNLKSSDTS